MLSLNQMPNVMKGSWVLLVPLRADTQSDISAERLASYAHARQLESPSNPHVDNYGKPFPGNQEITESTPPAQKQNTDLFLWRLVHYQITAALIVRVYFGVARC